MKQLLVALILIAFSGAAALAGDGIKWKREKGLIYADTETPPTSFGTDFEKIFDKHTIEWHAPIGHDLNYIVAIYNDWGLYCTYIKSTIKESHRRDTRIKKAADEMRDEYDGKFLFFVALATRRIEWGRITNKNFWEVYLEVDGKKTHPTTMEPLETDTDISSRYYFWADFSILPTTHHYANKFYRLEFENTAGNPRPRSLKLVLLSELCRRGFEWRFEEN